MKVNGIVKEQSFVVLTDDTRHDKTGSVWASYEKLSKKFDESFPPRTHTIFATDGCAGTKIVLFQVLYVIIFYLQHNLRTSNSLAT